VNVSAATASGNRIVDDTSAAEKSFVVGVSADRVIEVPDEEKSDQYADTE
jgi:hypothetical protein